MRWELDWSIHLLVRRGIPNFIKVSSLKWDCEAKEGNEMAEGLGAFLVNVVLMFIGVFLMISAYSQIGRAHV